MEWYYWLCLLAGIIIGTIYSLLKWKLEKKLGLRLPKKDPLGILFAIMGVIYGFMGDD